MSDVRDSDEAVDKAVQLTHNYRLIVAVHLSFLGRDGIKSLWPFRGEYRFTLTTLF